MPQGLIPGIDGQQLVHGLLVYAQRRAQLGPLDFQELVLKAAAAAKFTARLPPGQARSRQG